MPTSVVTMPMGMVMPGAISFDAMDAANRMTLPVSALAGKYQRWSSPQTWRAICGAIRSEEHTSELQSLMRISYAVFGLKQKQSRDTPVSHTNAICLQTQHK